MEQQWKLKSRVQDAAVQDRCPDTALANEGAAADGLTVLKFEVVAAVAAWVCNGPGEMVMEEVQAWWPLHEGECQMNTAVRAIIRTFCNPEKSCRLTISSESICILLSGSCC